MFNGIEPKSRVTTAGINVTNDLDTTLRTQPVPSIDNLHQARLTDDMTVRTRHLNRAVVRPNAVILQLDHLVICFVEVAPAVCAPHVYGRDCRNINFDEFRDEDLRVGVDVVISGSPGVDGERQQINIVAHKVV